MAGNFEYYAELGLNAGAAISELSRVSSTADAVTKNLDAMGKALDQVGKGGSGLKSGAEAKQLRDTLGLYQQLAGAVTAYGKSLQTINSTDLNNGVRKTATSLQHMDKALRGVNTVGGDQVEAFKTTLGLYKQLADASKAYASTMKLEADAIKAVASAEKTRQATAASAASATTRAAGTDMWGVSKDERDQRRQAQVVMQAEREMQAEFKRREEAQRKAAAETAKSEEATRRAASATDAHTAATKRGSDAQEEHENYLASTRYALYEIAAAYTAAAAAAFALPVASAQVAIEMEAQFAHVARTTQAADAPLENLRRQFQDLSTEIPVTFEELSRIGTLGAQMGIAEQDLESFSDTVAKFAATTNVTADQASMSFGRLANMLHLTSADYEQLGSAVSELGTASVSTESEILAISESIATTANMAGFSADQVIGLSTAMASLRIRPEMARGAMQRIFANINSAVGDGGEQLAVYAQMLGLTNDAAADLWRNDPSQFFYGINNALSSMNDNVERSAFIREGLGFTNVRDVELLARLSNGVEVYADSLNLAADAYERGDYLDKESGVIFETTAATLERLAASFKAMLDSFGQGALNPIKAVAEVLISLFNAIRDMPQGFKTLASTVTILVGGFAAMRAAFALTTASMLAFRLVQQQIGQESVLTFSGMLAQAGKTFPGITAHTTAATAALNRFAVATGHAGGAMTGAVTKATLFNRAMSFMPLAGWVGLAATAVGAIASIGGAFDGAADAAQRHAEVMTSAMGGSESVMEALRADLADFASGAQSNPMAVVENGVIRVGDAASATRPLIDQYIATQQRMGNEFDATTAKIDAQRFAIGEHTQELINKGIADAAALDEANQATLARLIERGFNMGELQQAYLEGGVEGARTYARGFQSAVGDRLADVPVLKSALFSQEVLEETALLESLIDPIDGVIGGLQGAINQKEIYNQLGLSTEEDTEGLAGVEDAAAGASEALETLVDQMFRLVDAEAAVFAAMESLGAGLDENGLEFNTWTEEGRANLDNFRSVVDAMVADIVAQMESGAISADEAAAMFAADYDALLGQLAASGVDTSQFDYFRDYIDTLFESPVAVNINVDPAFRALEAVSQYAYEVLSNIAAQSDGLRGGLASWGAGVVQNTRTRYGAVAPPTPSRSAPRPTAQRPDRAAQFQALEASRARAEQERLAKAAEDAAAQTKKQADEQKKAADEAKKLREEIADAKDEGRIFEEIIKGLSSAFQETLHNFNQFQTARDTVEQHLISMRDAAADTAEQVRTLREEHRKLRQEASEDRVEARQAESFAAVARRYGDTERATDYSTQAKGARESAAEKERLAHKALNEADAINKNRLALTGYSEQAIKNRGDVRALQERMTDLILAYAETGATTGEVTAYAEQLRRKFVDQLVQMGYNRSDAEKLSRVFQNLKTDIDRIPRQVRIEARARVKEAEAALKNVARGRTATIDLKPRNKDFTISGNLLANDFIVGKQVKAPTLDVGRVTDYGNGITSNWARSGGGLIPGVSSGPSSRDDKIVIGRNGPEGTVRSGEFVIRKPAVDAIGLNALHALNSMSPGAAVMSSAPAVNASRGIQLVELLPHQVHQLAQAVSTVLAVDGKVLAGTTNAQNTNAARRGVK